MSKLMFLGDVHGNTPHLQKIAKKARSLGVDLIFQVGDFGFLFIENRLPQVDNVLSQFGVPMVWLDGNHENFNMLAELGATPQDDEPTQLTELVTYSPRGYVWEIDGVRIMTLGGAFSVDHEHRVEGATWWGTQECLTQADVARACDNGPVDILLAHDSPQLPLKLDLYMRQMGFDVDGYKLDAISRGNRLGVTAVMQAVDPKLLVHGHFHHRYNDIMADTVICGLGRDDSGNDSWVVIDTENLNEQIDGVIPKTHFRCDGCGGLHAFEEMKDNDVCWRLAAEKESGYIG